MPALACPTCGYRLRVRDGHLGRSVRCPQCSTVFTSDAQQIISDRARPAQPQRAWLSSLLLLAAVALAAPAVWAVRSAGWDIYGGLRGEPWREVARYLLFG